MAFITPRHREFTLSFMGQVGGVISIPFQEYNVIVKQGSKLLRAPFTTKLKHVRNLERGVGRNGNSSLLKKPLSRLGTEAVSANEQRSALPWEGESEGLL